MMLLRTSYAGHLHVRFDERGGETERWTTRRARERKTSRAFGAAGPGRHRASPRLYHFPHRQLVLRAGRCQDIDEQDPFDRGHPVECGRAEAQGDERSEAARSGGSPTLEPDV